MHLTKSRLVYSCGRGGLTNRSPNGIKNQILSLLSIFRKNNINPYLLDRSEDIGSYHLYTARQVPSNESTCNNPQLSHRLIVPKIHSPRCIISETLVEEHEGPETHLALLSDLPIPCWSARLALSLAFHDRLNQVFACNLVHHPICRVSGGPPEVWTIFLTLLTKRWSYDQSDDPTKQFEEYIQVKFIENYAWAYNNNRCIRKRDVLHKVLQDLDVMKEDIGV